MKRGIVFLLIFFILIASVSIVSSFSSENIGNLSHLIEKSYGPSDYIKGWINISLEDESAKSVFEDDRGNSINLIDLLKTNINKDSEYTCSPLNCETDYSASNPQTEKSFSLNDGTSTIFGFKFTGNLISVNSVNFTVESNALSSCYNQLNIDFFDDETIVIGNDKISDISCDDVLKRYGCFNDNESTEEYIIHDSPPYCQKIRLTESPGFKLGAWVKETTAGTKKLTMELYDNSGTSIKSCVFMEEISETGGEISCEINYSVIKSEDYYVCIYSDEGSGEYRIRGNSDPLIGCGFYGIPIPFNTPGAYQIFAEGKRFGAVGTLEISNSLPNEDTLGGKVSDYITDIYGIKEGYIDCSADCVVPIKFISGENQSINIKNLKIKYQKDTGEAEIIDFYDLSESPALVSADFQKLYLDEGNFSVPSKIGNYTFSLSLDNEEIFSEKVVVGKVPVIKRLIPTTTASAYPTPFEVTIEPDGNITKYEWDFGNGDTETTTTNKVSYTYNSTGTYKLTITVTDLSQRSSYKIFSITVGLPKEIINNKLKKMQKDLNNIKAQINSFSSFCQDSLKSILDTGLLEDKLEEIQEANKSASTESDYNKIMTDLVELEKEIPESITITTSADLISFYPEENNINLDVLKTVGGGDYDSSESKYIDAIFAWNQENIETKITFKELSAKYENFEEPILRTFELKINKKNETYNPYLILRKLDNLEFKENYQEKNESGYVYIDLTGSQTTIAFSTTEDVDFADLPLFISPAISKLSILDEEDEKEETLLKLALFILILFFLVIIGFISYIILQTWYKKKYENYLFKNRNELYNLISYIQNSKKRGLENKEIIIKLKKAGWKSEQVTYIIKKYAGKRTGMFEIPIGKILSRFKKKKVESVPPGRPMGNFSTKPRTFTSGSNLRRNKKRFFKI